MDILVLNPFFYPYMGGTEKHLMEVGRRLIGKYNIKILTAQLEDAKKNENIHGIDVIRIPAKILKTAPHPFPPPVPLFTSLVSNLKREMKGVSAIHVHNRFVFNAFHLRHVKNANKKLLLTIHNSRPAGIDPITDLGGSLYDDVIAQHLMKMCDGISAVSKNTLEATIPQDCNAKKFVIHNGVDEQIFAPRKKSNKWLAYFEKIGIKSPIIFTNARLVEQKGIKYLISAMVGIDAHLVIFGRGPLKQNLETEAKNLGIKAHFISERLSESDLAELYNSVDIFVLPSLYEPCAVALLEAMASAKPIIATAIGGNTELIDEGRNGIIVPPRSPEAIRNAILKIINEPEFAKKMSSRIRNKVLDRFTWDHVAENFDKFYKTFE